jgi:hypothetical protein
VVVVVLKVIVMLFAPEETTLEAIKCGSVLAAEARCTLAVVPPMETAVIVRLATEDRPTYAMTIRPGLVGVILPNPTVACVEEAKMLPRNIALTCGNSLVSGVRPGIM